MSTRTSPEETSRTQSGKDAGLAARAKRSPFGGPLRWLDRAASRDRTARTRTVRGVFGVALFFASLELLSRLSGLSQETLPRATTILIRLLSLFVDLDFLQAVGETLLAAFAGLGLATAIAVPLGIALGSFRATYDAASALIEFMRPVPSPALIPVALLIFGATTEMKVSLVVYATVWIVLFNAIYGVRDVDPVLKDNARVFGFSGFQILVRISLRSAAPFIYTGIRIAATAAFLVAVGAELLAGGSGGLGQWLHDYQNTGTNADYVYAGAFFAGLIGLAINFLLDLGERRLFPWNVATRGQA